MSEVSIYWYPAPPADAEKWKAAIHHGFGPAFVALDLQGKWWRVAQAHAGDGDDLRDVVYSVLREAGLPVE